MDATERYSEYNMSMRGVYHSPVRLSQIDLLHNYLREVNLMGKGSHLSE